MMLSPVIETERLILRRFKESDIDMQYEILTDKRLATYIKFPELSKEEELECIREWIKNANENNKASSKVLIKAGFIKDGYIANRRINLDGTYSGVEYYSKKK